MVERATIKDYLSLIKEDKVSERTARLDLGFLVKNKIIKRDEEKQRSCYEKMKGIIAEHEDFMITHKLFIKVMREKHHVCDLNDSKFYKRGPNF